MSRQKKSVKVKKKPVKNLKKKTVKKTMLKRKVKKVSAVPKGYNNVIPYLMVQESASDAINFYKKVFGAKEVMRMEHNGKVGHAELKIGDTKIMLADMCHKSNAPAPNHSIGATAISIHLYVKNVDDIVSRATSAGAKVVNPVEDRFYGDRNGVIEDPHGFHWCVSSRVENLTPAKMKKRAMEAYKA